MAARLGRGPPLQPRGRVAQSPLVPTALTAEPAAAHPWRVWVAHEVGHHGNCVADVVKLGKALRGRAKRVALLVTRTRWGAGAWAGAGTGKRPGRACACGPSRGSNGAARPETSSKPWALAAGRATMGGVRVLGACTWYLSVSLTRSTRPKGRHSSATSASVASGARLRTCRTCGCGRAGEWACAAARHPWRCGRPAAPAWPIPPWRAAAPP
jgi:hypothetical protein